MILRFACLSLAVHTAALMALHTPRVPWSLPAPELRVDFVFDSTQARDHRTRAAVPPAAAAMRRAPRSAPIDRAFAEPSDSVTEQLQRESEARRASHLRSAIYAEVARHFVYPALARRHGWEGRVALSLRLEGDGRLTHLRLVRSSGYPILDSNAIETLQRIGTLPRTPMEPIGHSQELALLIVYRLLES